MAEITVIDVEWTSIYNGPGRRYPFSNHYACVGPDGKRFTNSDRTTLAQVLRRNYGKVRLEITDHRSSDHLRMLRNGG